MPLRVSCPGPLLRLACFRGGGLVLVPPYLAWGCPPPTCCGRGCVGVGAQHCPLGLHALWGLRAAGVVAGRPRGGVACHCCEWCLVSGAVLPPAARALGRAARVPRPVFPGRGWCGRGHPAPVPQRAILRAVVARSGGGRGAPPGGLPRAVVRGVWVQALSLPRLPVLWAGCWGLLPTCRGRACVGVGAQHCLLGCAAQVVRGCTRGGWPFIVARGVWCQALSLPRPPVVWARLPGRGDPAPAPQRAPLRAVVARCEGGRRASPGGGALRRCERRLVAGARPLPAARPLSGLSGSAVLVLWVRVCGRGWVRCPFSGQAAGRGCVWCVWCLCGVCDLVGVWRCGV